MNNYNKMPNDSVVINNYDDFSDFFIFKLEPEFRQPYYNENNSNKGQFNLRIFWINKEKGLGFGLGRNWKNKKIDLYRFGSNQNWKQFKTNFASQFENDNS